MIAALTLPCPAAPPRRRAVTLAADVATRLGSARPGGGVGATGGDDMADQMTRRRVVVHGRVQGVFFRDSARSEAQREGVAGWVRNRDDGAVEAVFEGEREAVERLVEWCRSGPSSADVEDVEESEEQPEGLSGFETR